MKNKAGRTLKKAFLRSLPVMAGYLVLGTGFGILLQKSGHGVVWALAMSLFIYAGSLQFLGVSLLSGGASLLTTALTTLMVNARHLFYGLSMLEKYKGAGREKPYLIFALTDETYSLVTEGAVPEGCSPYTFYFFLSLFNQCYWVAGSVLGAALGRWLPMDTAGIEFSMTALFVSVFVEQWLQQRNHLPALIGVGVTAACLLLLGKDSFLIPAMGGILLLLTLLRRKLTPQTPFDVPEEGGPPCP